MIRTGSLALAAALVLLSSAGCSGKDASDVPAASTPTAGTSGDATPTPDADAWRADYSADQLSDYDAALTRWKQYQTGSREIFAKGEDTPEARQFFETHALQSQTDIALLVRYYDAGGVRNVRDPEPLSFKAISIKPGVVVISQCTDYSDVLLEQNGKEVPDTKPAHLVTPLEIEMTKPQGRDWMVATTDLKDTASCAG